MPVLPADQIGRLEEYSCPVLKRRRFPRRLDRKRGLYRSLDVLICGVGGLGDYVSVTGWVRLRGCGGCCDLAWSSIIDSCAWRLAVAHFLAADDKRYFHDAL